MKLEIEYLYCTPHRESIRSVPVALNVDSVIEVEGIVHLLHKIMSHGLVIYVRLQHTEGRMDEYVITPYIWERRQDVSRK